MLKSPQRKVKGGEKMSTLSSLWTRTRDFLYPYLEEELEPLTQKQRDFISVCELAQLDKHMRPYRGRWLGRKKKPRVDFAKAFVAKAIYNFPTTEVLIDHLRDCKNLRRLCGWEHRCNVPSAATFSRAFTEFAEGGLGDIVHAAMVKNMYQDKIAGHISRDSTAIKAREKAVKKETNKPKPKRKRGRPRKGEVVETAPPKRLDLQLNRSLQENIDDLPMLCDWGTKKNSQGKKETWKGYKLHLDCTDGDIPVSAVITSASTHDSQAAIPLTQTSAERVTSLYDLMDAAYDAPQIKTFSQSVGHVPIIDPNPRRGEKEEMDPATKVRYNERSTAERVNSMLKDNYGGRFIRVRGAVKVKLHLMFGLIVICATQLIRLLQ